MFFLNPEKAVEECFAHPLNYGSLLEETLRDINNYAKDYMEMRKLEDDVNTCADSLGQQPQLEEK